MQLLEAIAPDVLPQAVNIQTMDVELVAQMFKNYQSNVLFHLEGMICLNGQNYASVDRFSSHGKLEGAVMIYHVHSHELKSNHYTTVYSI